jgi:hypothetical protein
MSSSRLQVRRVERLEQVARDEHRRWLASLTIDELEARFGTLPPLDPKIGAALDELSEAELDWLTSTSGDDADFCRRLRWLERRRRISTPDGH